MLNVSCDGLQIFNNFYQQFPLCMSENGDFLLLASNEAGDEYRIGENKSIMQDFRLKHEIICSLYIENSVFFSHMFKYSSRRFGKPYLFYT